ncbi:BirA family biotin operon repressor/biotin-[acetyl-CoA-carboxylase] ligase [Planomicrobium soli]|uniref:Bifunctional ligase/repressor BirA n=1 Tax=Planomicrobium soli TaxID=1176648 RepID=A0A2P8H6V5_9BACL|nr:biotin--[acetyl-CoA-carboxylase] ligase [Planomicrobium soli]PSL41956.1 BirA family biotin operon repressor/biotin-[acetyl-CoA-carboxylase] ligase [Planomicrobium soli]
MNITVTHELAKRLMEAGGEALSGQYLADEFGISRTAVWKHIKELEEKGYTIESIKKRGYILKEIPDTLEPIAIQPLLKTAKIGQVMEYIDSCPSTQILAHKFAQEGAPDGTVVLTETQTAGRGRLARKWDSAPQKGIWMSVILRPDVVPQKAPQFTLVAAVAVVRAIEEVTGLKPEIKWPNDILLNGRKCTGILTELQSDADGIQALIIGIGMNANQELEDFSPEVRDIATSLKMMDGKTVDRQELVRSLLFYLEQYTNLYIEQGFKMLKIMWESYSSTIGRPVRARMAKETLEGIAEGITDEGVLQLRTNDGKLHGIYSADIEMKN